MNSGSPDGEAGDEESELEEVGGELWGSGGFIVCCSEHEPEE